MADAMKYVSLRKRSGIETFETLEWSYKEGKIIFRVAVKPLTHQGKNQKVFEARKQLYLSEGK